jgi:para-nitrobenzyl esterase
MRKLAILLLLVTACRTTRSFPFAVTQADQATVRHTTAGDVVGGQGRYGAQAWLGIPFAEPPVGALRWRAPRPPKPWNGVREALRFGPACAQMATQLGSAGKEGDVVGSEDCLTLNVYAPPSARGLPVMLWIHGGGNSIGSTTLYEGGHLATSQNLVVITTQYRLGPLGWFRHKSLRAESDDPVEQSGNFGTLDLIRALEWVRDNAAAFGGDPNNVTVLGESAGGTNVYTLLMAKPAKGLFHRAIVESGFLRGTDVDDAEAFHDESPRGSAYSSNEILVDFLAHDGKARGRAEVKQRISSMRDADTAAYLRSKTPQQLLSLYKRQFGMIQAPFVFRDGAVLPKGEWLDALAAGAWNQVPVILGTNRDEYKLFEVIDPRRTWRLFGILPHYRDEGTYQVLGDSVSRVWKALGVDAPAEAMLRSGAREVYAYRFDWRGEPSILGSDLKAMVGAAHATEIPFVFGHFDLGPMNILFGDDKNGERRALSDTMMKLWGSFARDGKPGGGWSPEPGTMLLNMQSEGGVHMSDVHETVEKVVTDIDTDPRITTPLQRCQVFHDLATFRGKDAEDTYELAARGTCDAFPFATYPWQ